LPDKSLWLSLFSRCKHVTITEERHADADAALVSVSRCEKFGCRSGSSDETLGVMAIYDSWKFEESNPFFPRFQVSNAVWRNDPPLEIAVARRLDILAATLTEFNQDAEEPLRSINIDCATLGFWAEYSDEVQKKPLGVVKAKIEEHFGC
jgi:hypothetical protein